MKHIAINAEGTLVCPVCGATSFSNRRTRGAKLAAGVTVGVGALAAPKRMQCLGCREYLKSPPVPLANVPQGAARAAAADVGDIEITITGTRGSKMMLPTILEVAHPKRLTKQRKEEIRDAIKAGEPVVLDVVPAHEVAGITAQLDKVKMDYETWPVDDGDGEPAAPAAAAASTAPDIMEQIRKLGELHDAGVLTVEEFDAKKTELLGRL